MLIISCAPEQQQVVPDIFILYDQESFRNQGVELEKLEIRIENGPPLIWKPGMAPNLYDILGYADSEVKVSHFITFRNGETSLYVSREKVYKDIFAVTTNVIEAGKPWFDQMSLKTIRINPDTSYGVTLKSMEIQIIGEKTSYSKVWKPGEPETFEVYLFEEQTQVNVFREVETYMQSAYIKEGVYTIASGQTSIDIDTGPFTNFYVVCDDNVDIHILPLTQTFPPPLPGDGTKGISIPLKDFKGTRPIIKITHDSDLIVSGSNDDYMYYKRKKDGSYDDALLIENWPVDHYIYFTGDFNHDFIEDLFLLKRQYVSETDKRYSMSYKIAMGIDGRRFDFSQDSIEFMSGQWISGCEITDINGDKWYDLIYFYHDTGVSFSTKIYVLYGNEAGGLAAEPEILFSETDQSAFGIDTGDVNNDGFVDILLGSDDDNYDSGLTALLLNDGTGNFYEVPVVVYGDKNKVLAAYFLRGEDYLPDVRIYLSL